MKILITGNPNYGLAEACSKILEADYVSRSNGFDLTSDKGQIDLANHSLNYNIVVNNSALHNFCQTQVLYSVWKKWVENNHIGHIINIGSTIDTSRKGRAWMYSAEKKALMEASLELGTIGVWGDSNIKVSYISFGSLSTPKVINKHPDRTLLDVNKAAEYVKWIIESPAELNINILHLDPMQKKNDSK